MKHDDDESSGAEAVVAAALFFLTLGITISAALLTFIW